MILQTGQRTDIPAFYSEWFANRLKEGMVRVRNPYDPKAVTEYTISPDVVDVIAFCTKNPEPVFPYMHLLEPYGQYWFVTITGYGRDIERNVPETSKVIETFQKLSRMLGSGRIAWRYDPILLTGRYTTQWHINMFREIAERLAGYTDTAVISFIDMYPKVVRNFPGVHQVMREDRLMMGERMALTAGACGMVLKPCGEGNELSRFGADCSGCMTMAVYEKGAGMPLRPPRALRTARESCVCYLSGDIGAYNSCGHFCKYCYANTDIAAVAANMRRHDVKSPFLLGHDEPGDIVRHAVQKSWKDYQMRLEI
ncbi:MAG: DUF1848 domain-containing protein [Clostridia bacterium]|nr:DUF1848 domain-containing protein [Clostridia bacterium]